MRLNFPARTGAHRRASAAWMLGVCIGLHVALSALALPAHAAGLHAADAQDWYSPDWRDQILYFAMIDRFDDGDPTNNDQGAGEFDPADSRRYSGGDLAGLTRRLDYLRELGATALWITPPVRHQWWDASVGYGGYHGYWGEHFMQVDPHFGSLDDYRALSRGLHARGMALVQDIVVNHTGNYFDIEKSAGDFAAGDRLARASGFALNSGAAPTRAPTQWPFSQNDARDPQQRSLDIYHWTPAITDYSDPRQLLNWQMAGLDDLNTDNPQVRRALRASYGHWIREVGVDAYRIDTAFYVPPEYFRDFLYADDPAAPGMLEVAKRSGRDNFLLFGEGFAIDRPYEDVQARRIDTYLRDEAGPLLPSMLNFPLYGSSLDVFARGLPPAVLTHRIESMLSLHADPHRMPSFVDNHDVDRFLAGGSEAGLKQALLALMTLPGIPVIYYGTEQGFREVRSSMFAAGWGSGGKDHFDRDAPLYRYLQRATGLRHAQAALRRARPHVLAAEAAAAGTLAYLSHYQGDTLLVALNTADAETLFGALDTGLAAGSRLQPLFAIEGVAPALEVDSEGRIDLRLPPRAGHVWKLDETVSTAQTAARPTLSALPEAAAIAQLTVAGHASAGHRLALLVDGEIDRALPLRADAQGRFRSVLDVRGLSDPALSHRLQVLDLDTGRSSLSRTFRVQPDWQTLARIEDPIGDDHGPAGRYRYPTDPGWGERGLLDLRRIEAAASGGSLHLDIELGDLSQGWNPANGFDRVALTLYLSLPGRADGARLMPGQNDQLPDGLRWQRRLRVNGWTNVLTAFEGADAEHEGRPVGGAKIDVDVEAHRIRLSLPARALGDPADLRGATVLLTTWDFDGRYRRLSPDGGAMVFGGGDDAQDPLWMDRVLLRLGE